MKSKLKKLLTEDLQLDSEKNKGIKTFFLQQSVDVKKQLQSDRDLELKHWALVLFDQNIMSIKINWIELNYETE